MPSCFVGSPPFLLLIPLCYICDLCGSRCCCRWLWHQKLAMRCFPGCSPVEATTRRRAGWSLECVYCGKEVSTWQQDVGMYGIQIRWFSGPFEPMQLRSFIPKLGFPGQPRDIAGDRFPCSQWRNQQLKLVVLPDILSGKGYEAGRAGGRLGLSSCRSISSWVPLNACLLCPCAGQG